MSVISLSPQRKKLKIAKKIFFFWVKIPWRHCYSYDSHVNVFFLQNYQQPPVDYESNKELKKLQFYGAGPKAALPDLTNEGITSEI